MPYGNMDFDPYDLHELVLSPMNMLHYKAKETLQMELRLLIS